MLLAVGDDFDKSDDCPEVLSEDDSCTVETTFVPLVSGNILSNLLVNDSTEIGFHKAHLMGHAISSDITLLPAGVDFGDQTTGRPSLPHDVRIFNSGTELGLRIHRGGTYRSRRACRFETFG